MSKISKHCLGATAGFLLLIVTGIMGCGNIIEEVDAPPGEPATEEKEKNSNEQEKPSDIDNNIPPAEVETENDENNQDEDEQENNSSNNENEQDSPGEAYSTPLPWKEMVDSLSFLESPIPGAQITTRDTQLPGALRPYRNGTHEGLDYYDGYCGVDIYFGAPVYAAAEGNVLRIDHDFQELTTEEREKILQVTKELGYTPEEDLDKLRGRQVWIQHREEVITRYAHLDEVSENLDVGTRVSQGDYIGSIGNSGTSAAVAGTKEGPHLHFEIWVKEHYLGKGLPPEKVRTLWEKILLEE